MQNCTAAMDLISDEFSTSIRYTVGAHLIFFGVFMLILSISFLFACRSGSAKVQLDEDTSVEEPEWWESDVEETDDSEESSSSDSDEEKEEDTGDKPEDEEFEDEKDSGLGDTEDCGEDFDSSTPCEGDWATTLCMHDGLYWWCEDGVWINEEDK